MPFPKGFGQRIGAFRFSMNQPDFLLGTSGAVEVVEQFTVIGVPRKAVEDLDFGAEFERLTKDVYLLPVVANFPAEGVFCAIADEEDSVLRILNVVAQVMEDSARLTHARCRNDDTGFVRGIEFL